MQFLTSDSFFENFTDSMYKYQMVQVKTNQVQSCFLLWKAAVNSTFEKSLS